MIVFNGLRFGLAFRSESPSGPPFSLAVKVQVIATAWFPRGAVHQQKLASPKVRRAARGSLPNQGCRTYHPQHPPQA